MGSLNESIVIEIYNAGSRENCKKNAEAFGCDFTRALCSVLLAKIDDIPYVKEMSLMGYSIKHKMLILQMQCNKKNSSWQTRNF